MNQFTFALKNVLDKFAKVAGSWETVIFYWQTYILSRFDKVDSDIYVISYPKCGRTWIRVMLQRYLELHGLTQKSFNDKSIVAFSGLPVIKFEHDQGNWVPASLRIDQLNFRATRYQDKKVLFMVRDPRDVLVSSWYHLKYRERIFPRSLADFIQDDLVGVHKVIAFTNMWMENRHLPVAFSLLKYEEMHKKPVDCFQNVLHFMGIAVDPDKAKEAVEWSSFDRMKQIEIMGALKEPWMKPGTKWLGESLKVRRGKVGSYREELSKEEIAYLDAVIQRDLTAELSQYHRNR